MRRVLAGVCVLLFGSALPASGSPAGIPPEHTIRGRVVSGEAALAGVAVRLGGEIVATTDPSGRFEITVTWQPSLDIEFSREGFHSHRIRITPEVTGDTTLAIDLLPLPRVSESIIVTARRELGVLQKETAVHVVAREDLERTPGTNAAEAIAATPGVTILWEESEADDVFVRGMEPRLTSTMIDGERIPSPDGDDRTAEIFVIPLELLEAIEVQTTFTPEMDGDVVGGSVNLLTRKTPPERLTRLTLGSGFDHQSDGGLVDGSVTLAQRFASTRLGILFSGVANDGDRGTDRVVRDYADGEPNRFEIQDFTFDRRRLGGLTRLDFMASPRTEVTGKLFFSNYSEELIRRRVEYDPGESTIGRGILDEGTTKRIGSADVAASHVLPGFIRIGYRLGYSESREKEPDTFDTTFVQDDVAFVDGASGPVPIGESIDRFVLDEIRLEKVSADDANGLLGFDIAVPFTSAGGSAEVRAGLKFRDKDKRQDRTAFLFEPEDDIPITDFLDGSFRPETAVAGRAIGPMFDPENVAEIIERYGLEGMRLIEQDAGDYDANERSVAGYALAETGIGERATFLGGLRYERTRSRYEGFEVTVTEDEPDAPALLAVAGRREYAALMPAALVVVELGGRTKMKAGISRTFARPDYIHLVPFTLINQSDGEIERGNPDLHLTRSWNADLSFDAQPADRTAFNVSLFYKSIDDFVFESRSETTFDDRVFTLIQPRNGRRGRLLGTDVSLRQQFGAGRGWHKGLYYDLNLSWSESRASIADRPAESIPLPGHARLSGSLTVGRRQGPASFGIVASHVGEQLLELGSSSGEDIRAGDRFRVDLFCNVALSGRWDIVVRAANLTSDALRHFEGRPDRPLSVEYSGWSSSASVRFTL